MGNMVLFFTAFSFGMGISISCQSHHYILKADDYSGFTYSQLGTNIWDLTNTLFKWYWDDINLSLWHWVRMIGLFGWERMYFAYKDRDSASRGRNSVPHIHVLKFQLLGPQNTKAFGDKVVQERMKIRTIHEDRILIQCVWSPYRKRQRHQGCMPREGKAMWGHSRQAVFCKPRRLASGDAKAADTLILDV